MLNNRRTFLKSAAAATAGFSLFTLSGTKASGNVIGANDRIRIGVAGINGRGGAHINGFAPMENVEVSYLIDPDSRLFDSRTKNVESKGGNKPTCVQDIREALDDKNLDAVSVATCNHWHSLITVWACQAGKDVYVEKPMSHNIWEGRQCVAAAKKYDRIVQHGTQNRSSGGIAKLMATIHAEKYGKLLVSKGYCCKPRWSIGKKSIGDPPNGFDFNLWLGPAPVQAFHGNLHTYNWHWFWDFGNGDTGNQGVHQIDIARWAIKDATHPNAVWSVGGRFIPGGDDQGETPNMQITVFEYGDVKLLFETRGLVGKGDAPKPNVSNEFYTTDGLIRGGKFYPNGSDKGESLKYVDGPVAPGGAFGSFIAAMRSRKPEDQNCNAEVAHYSSALCHLANISYRTGEDKKFSSNAEKFGDDDRVVGSFRMLADNLKAVDVELKDATYRVGPHLKFDPEKETFLKNEAANKLLTRPYRKPFVVPEIS